MPEWELNYDDRETLRPKLLERCKAAVRKYLLYKLDNGTEGQKSWCEDNIRNVSQLAEEMTHYVTSEPGFIAGGTSLSDTAIQSRVETVMSAYYLPS